MDKSEYPFKELGPRQAPDRADVRAFARLGLREGGRRSVPTAARVFQARVRDEVMPYPEIDALPKWVLALVERKVSIEEFAQTVYDRTLRAPSAENQRLALLLANEVARRPDGNETLTRYLTPELLLRVNAGEDEA